MWNKTVSKDDLPELPPVTRELFLQFYTISDGSISHPKDRQRFLEFIRYCHGKNVKLNEFQFKSMLIRISCPELSAIKLSELYASGRELLKANFPYVPST